MTIQQIDELIEEGQSLKLIAQAYSEIADLKIKRIKNEVLRNRLFFEEISSLYAYVKALALKKGVTSEKPKKRVYILITSNHRFYGNINSALVKEFDKTRNEPQTDRIVIGKSAIDYFSKTKVFENFEPILLKEDMPTPEELKFLIEKVNDYNQVLVFFSKLKSLMVQIPTTTDLRAVLIPKNADLQKLFFIFEPELSKILAFFDSQVLTLLLEQTFLESELSRTASRFISMDQAETEANKFIEENLKLKTSIKRGIENNKILENFATLLAIRKREHA